MPRNAMLAALLVALAVIPRGARAQAAAASPAAPVVAPATPVPLGVTSLTAPAPSRFDTAAARPFARETSLEPLLAPYRTGRHAAPGVVLMIVGGAGIVLGALIEEDIVTIAGAGVGLYGLYLYLR